MSKTITISLEIINGIYDGMFFHFDTFPVSVGRATDNDISIPFESAASRSHAQIVKEGDSFYVIDLKSTNGTLVNSQKVIDRTSVFTDDIITIGDTNIRCNLNIV